MQKNSSKIQVITWGRYNPKTGIREKVSMSTFGRDMYDPRYFKQNTQPRKSIRIRGITLYKEQ